MDLASQDLREARKCVSEATSRVSEATSRAAAAAKVVEQVISLNGWCRCPLAFMPKWPLIGDICEVVADIEDLLTTPLGQRAAEADSVTKCKYDGPAVTNHRNQFFCRDDLPFVYVVNPPRHGKSLLLDLLADGSRPVAVISYNGVDPPRPWEVVSCDAAWLGFQTRLIWALVGGNPCKRDAASWRDVMPIPWSSVACHLPEGLIVLVDEFSNFTDAIHAAHAEATMTLTAKSGGVDLKPLWDVPPAMRSWGWPGRHDGISR